MVILNLKQRFKQRKKTFKQIRYITSLWIHSIASIWVHKTTLVHLNTIRLYELNLVLKLMPSHSNILEIGAGTGWQARALDKKGYHVSAIDIPISGYIMDRVWPIIDYDGANIPFKNNTFDIVFSSNVIEHIPDIYDIQLEIHRVLKPQGIAIHIVPSASWRFWTILTNLLSLSLILKAHGEHARNAITEIYHFCSKKWISMFNITGWHVISHYKNQLFYTGNSIMDSRINMKVRHLLSKIMGSACHIFVLKRNNIHQKEVNQDDRGCNDGHKVN